jgi:hypothetical protein
MKDGAIIGQREMDNREELGLMTLEGAGGAPTGYWEDRYDQQRPLAVRHNPRRAVSYLEREGRLNHGYSFEQDRADHRPGFRFSVKPKRRGNVW